MKFYDWVILFKDVDRPIKDLAQDVHRDVLKAFEKAYAAYKVATRS